MFLTVHEAHCSEVAAEEGFEKVKTNIFQGGRKSILYRFDSPTTHSSETVHLGLEEWGISQKDRAPLPTYSPDMH